MPIELQKSCQAVSNLPGKSIWALLVTFRLQSFQAGLNSECGAATNPNGEKE